MGESSEVRLGLRRRTSTTALSPIPFVILTSGRSGSSWLMEMLNSHPVIGGYGELLSTRFRTAYPQTRAAVYGDPGGVRFFGSYLEQRRRVNPVTVPYLGVHYLGLVHAPREGLHAIGYRVRYGQLRATWGGVPAGGWLLPYMAARRVRVIHLVRRNSLDFAISQAAAMMTGLRHMSPDEAAPESRVTLDPDAIVRKLDEYEAHERLVRRAIRLFRLPTHELGYEELLAETTPAYRRVLGFLGVQPVDHEPQWGMRKIIDRPRHEVVENYEAVRAVLAATKYASLLD